MSLITEVVLFAGEWERHPHAGPHVTQEMLERVAEDDEWHARGQGLRLLTKGGDRKDGQRRDIWGGSKVPSGNVYGAAFNYLTWDKFKAWLESLPWRYPEYVRVLVNREGDRAFGLWAFTWPPAAPWDFLPIPLQEPDLGLLQDDGANPGNIEQMVTHMLDRRARNGTRPERLTLSRVFPFDGARS